MADNPRLEAALSYARRGWPVIPLHSVHNGRCTCSRGIDCQTPGKHPKYHKENLPHGARSASTAESLIKKWWDMWPGANVGIATGQASFDVLDVDLKGSGVETLRLLEAKHGKLPRTIRQRTGSGGCQIFFEYSGVIANKVRFAAGLDTRSDGGLVVVPPSTHISGGTYAWEEGCAPADTPLAEMPSWLINSAGKPADSGSGTEDLEDLEGLDVASVLDGVPEGERDTQLFRYACRLRGIGVSFDEARALVTLAADNCSPPFSEDEALKKLESAWKYTPNEAKNRSLESAEQDAPLDLVEFTGDAPPRRWIIDQWLPEGEVSSLYGDGGLGKSLLACQLGYAVAHGIPFLGLETCRMPTLYVACEDDRDEIHRRIQAIRSHAGEFVEENGVFRAWPRVGKDSLLASFREGFEVTRTGFFESLQDRIRELGRGPKFVILDTLSDFFGGSEINRYQANSFVKVVIRGMVEDHQATVLFLAHPSQAGKNSGDLLSGSTAWNNAVRNRLVLKIGPLPDLRILQRIKSNYALRGVELQLAWENGVFVPTTSDAMFHEMTAAHGELIRALIEQHAEAGMPLGRTKNHRKSLKKLLERSRLKGTDGSVLSFGLVDAIVDNLIRLGRIIEVRGDKKGRNGLFTREIE